MLCGLPRLNLPLHACADNPHLASAVPPTHQIVPHERTHEFSAVLLACCTLVQGAGARTTIQGAEVMLGAHKAHLYCSEDGHALNLAQVVVCAVGVSMEHILYCWHHHCLCLLAQPTYTHRLVQQQRTEEVIFCHLHRGLCMVYGCCIGKKVHEQVAQLLNTQGGRLALTAAAAGVQSSTLGQTRRPAHPASRT